MLLGRQHQRRSAGALHHSLKARLDLQQPMPPDLPVYRFDSIFIGIMAACRATIVSRNSREALDVSRQAFM